MRNTSSISSALLSSLALALVALSGCADLTTCKRGTEGCICDAPPPGAIVGTCDGALLCSRGTCRAPDSPGASEICFDACRFRQSGTCDDGGEGSDFSDCPRGNDCSDCGPRPNPCTDPARPVYCPQTPNNCWPMDTSCRSVRFCPGDPDAKGCPTGTFVNCAAGTCGPQTVPGCNSAGSAPCQDENKCIPLGATCNSLHLCPGQTEPAACFFDEQVSCTPQGVTCAAAP